MLSGISTEEKSIQTNSNFILYSQINYIANFNEVKKKTHVIIRGVMSKFSITEKKQIQR